MCIVEGVAIFLNVISHSYGSHNIVSQHMDIKYEPYINHILTIYYMITIVVKRG